MIVNPASVVLTAHVAHWTDDHPARTAWILNCLQRHNTGDLGDLDDDDTAANNHALRHHDGRILSRYPIHAELIDPTVTDVALWVIADDLDDVDALTTVLWPSDH
jgi:hypothetical protein